MTFLLFATWWMRPPTGDFTVKHPENERVLIAGGVGITPLLSMLQQRIESGVDVSGLMFICCCKDRSHHVMTNELRRLSAQHSFTYYVSYETGSGADHHGYLNPSILSQWLGQLHYDVFGPCTLLPTH